MQTGQLTAPGVDLQTAEHHKTNQLEKMCKSCSAY